MRWLPKPRHLRFALLVLAAVAAIVFAVGIYFAFVGHRELEAELALLRASGEPEFPEQLPFETRPPGGDPSAWWKQLEETWQVYEVKGLEACAARLASGEEDWSIEDDCTRCLSNPRRIEALSDCERAVLDLRAQADEASLDVAMQVASIAPFDWRAAWTPKSEEFSGLLVIPPISGYIRSIDVLCAGAVHCALHSDATGARARLAEALGALRVLDESQTLVSGSAWIVARNKWILYGLLPLLHLSKAGEDFTEFEAFLGAIDVRARLRDSLIGERTMGNRLFRWQRTNIASVWKQQPWELPDWLVTRTWLDRDQATYLEVMRRAIAATEAPLNGGPWEELESVIDGKLQGTFGIAQRPFSALLLPRLREDAVAADALHARIVLCRAALIARRDGPAAARAFLDGQPDPFDGEPLRSRLDPDGVLVMWSVGDNRRDDPQEPAVDDTHGARPDDIRVLVRPR